MDQRLQPIGTRGLRPYNMWPLANLSWMWQEVLLYVYYALPTVQGVECRSYRDFSKFFSDRYQASSQVPETDTDTDVVSIFAQSSRVVSMQPQRVQKSRRLPSIKIQISKSSVFAVHFSCIYCWLECVTEKLCERGPPSSSLPSEFSMRENLKESWWSAAHVAPEQSRRCAASSLPPRTCVHSSQLLKPPTALPKLSLGEKCFLLLRHICTDKPSVNA